MGKLRLQGKRKSVKLVSRVGAKKGASKIKGKRNIGLKEETLQKLGLKKRPRFSQACEKRRSGSHAGGEKKKEEFSSSQARKKKKSTLLEGKTRDAACKGEENTVFAAPEKVHLSYLHGNR